MGHSNSSLNCFASCMAKYKYSFIDNIPPETTSPHLQFGVMAHDTLYKAGKLRDDNADKVVEIGEYVQVIPSEVLYNDLKDAFSIKSWNNYFIPIIKQTYLYEKSLIEELIHTDSGPVVIERELKLQLTPEQLLKDYGVRTDEPLSGIIDLLIRTDKYAYILDYKFSSKAKTQDDFDLNSQLQLYSLFVNKTYGIKPHNIKYGYIDIPKQEFGRPTLLSNGTLSRAKSQNVSQDLYKLSVQAIHGDDPYYNCEPGGYYEEIYNNLANNKAAYLSIQWLDEDVFKNVIGDIMKTISVVQMFKVENLPYLRKYDSYSCKNCEYLKHCKPWLTVEAD